jgi:hypothetical protein
MNKCSKVAIFDRLPVALPLEHAFAEETHHEEFEDIH